MLLRNSIPKKTLSNLFVPKIITVDMLTIQPYHKYLNLYHLNAKELYKGTFEFNETKKTLCDGHVDFVIDTYLKLHQKFDGNYLFEEYIRATQNTYFFKIDYILKKNNKIIINNCSHKFYTDSKNYYKNIDYILNQYNLSHTNNL